MDLARNAEEHFINFEVPLPVDEAGEIAVERGELDRRIQRYASVTAGRDPSKSFLNRYDYLQQARLTFKATTVSVRVPIPSTQQALLFDRPKARRTLTRDLFDERPDDQVKRDIDECLREIQSVQPAIDEVRTMLQSDALSTSEIANLDGVMKNPLLRIFAVEGGAFDVNVDGESVHIESTAMRIAIPLEQTTDIEVSLHKGQSSFSGRVTGVHAGAAGIMKPGIIVLLGWMGDRDDTRATLMFARHFGFNVALRVRQAVSTKRMKLMTLEVVEVLNQVEVLDRTREALGFKR
jgi:hypothetical protein